jgi:4-aminobutyrate aminotransferase-like enzyme
MRGFLRGYGLVGANVTKESRRKGRIAVVEREEKTGRSHAADDNAIDVIVENTQPSCILFTAGEYGHTIRERPSLSCHSADLSKRKG